MGFSSCFQFTPVPVTILTIITYVSLLAALLFIHHVPPKVGSSGELSRWGVDLDEAWADLQELSREFHPYNSRRNDAVRDYLIGKIKKTLADNGVKGFGTTEIRYEGDVELFDDSGEGASNVTFAGSSTLQVYYEGTNIMVYIKGSGDEDERSPVLVNAHYDGVSTGYGTTDDGIAVVSCLQIIKSFTRPVSRQISRGLIVLLNNGEEDYLNGARAFAVHPLAKKPHAFLNLEGAAAGGRAILFRSTDAEVTEFYKDVKRPLGSVISGDGFKQGMIRSQTDYKVFVENLGMRGLDVAFWEHRSRYHTQDDDTRYTSMRSLWHMLGNSLFTLKAMTDDTSSEFDTDDGTAGTGHDAVWFDLFGRALAVFRLHTLFALVLTLIIVPTVILILTAWILVSSNKFYFLTNTLNFPQPPEGSNIPETTRGWRGFTRWYIAFIIATAAVIGGAFLIEKLNPMIVYSSPYAVWAMFLGLWWSLMWFILRGTDAVRPSALQRGYGFNQQWFLWLVILIIVAVSINKLHIASGYPVIFIYAGVWLAAWISLLELFGLCKKPKQLTRVATFQDETPPSEGHSQIAASEYEPPNFDNVDETTPLYPRNQLGRGYIVPRRQADSDDEDDDDESTEADFVLPQGVYGQEQAWSKDMPSWLWIIQFLVAVPVPTIFTTSIGLILATALYQTGADGSNMLTVYLLMALLSAVIFLPVTPFMHRVTYHITVFAFLVFVGTLIYNLVAFPFSPQNRLKVYFQQTVELETGLNQVHLVGHTDYIEHLVSRYVPSAQGKNLTVIPDPNKAGLTRVSWPGTPPNVANTILGVVPPINGMKDWVDYHITKKGVNHTQLFVKGQNTRACKILFNKNVTDVDVQNGHDALGNSTVLGEPAKAITELRLWSRDWERGWNVSFSFGSDESDGESISREEENELLPDSEPTHTELKRANGVDGKVVCLWSDANNAKHDIPAFEEVVRYLPNWAVVSKLADGLVEGSRPFMI